MNFINCAKWGYVVVAQKVNIFYIYLNLLKITHLFNLILSEETKIEPPTVHEPYYPQIPVVGETTQQQTIDNNNAQAGNSNSSSMETSEVISFDYTNNAFDDSEIKLKKVTTL